MPDRMAVHAAPHNSSPPVHQAVGTLPDGGQGSSGPMPDSAAPGRLLGKTHVRGARGQQRRRRHTHIDSLGLARTRACTHTHTQTSTHLHTHTRARAHERTHAHANTPNTHAHMRTRTHVSMHQAHCERQFHGVGDLQVHVQTGCKRGSKGPKTDRSIQNSQTSCFKGHLFCLGVCM